MENTAANLHTLERKVLPHLDKHQELTALATASKLQEIEVMRALQWLSNKGLVETEQEKTDMISLDANGLRYREEGLPERRALKLLEKGSQSTQELTRHGIGLQEINIVIGALKKKAAINIKKKDKHVTLTITEQGRRLLKKESLEESFLKKRFPIPAASLKPEERFAYNNLKKRKDILKTETRKAVKATLTKAGAALLKEGISQATGLDRLTPSMLKDGTWKKKRFRAYDVSTNVPRINRGKQHFVNEAIEYAKSIWLEMGFKEMTGTQVQTAFWDLDSLFVPQDHPAREMQDTYYLKQPANGRVPDKQAWERVKAVHEDGGDTGSKGWRTPFDKGLALKNLLRTHTTVLSAQTIAKAKQTGIPAKFFAISKVYRNEALDWKHLFEFHQVEGIVIDPNANLRHLKGYLEEFYKKIGFPKVRMRPGHFPYTEPSIEPEVWHPIKEQWVEMGGAGIFRPEVTKTLIGEEIPVLAWGLGLERIISPYYDIHDIRELYDNDLKQLQRMKNFIKT
ncbi:phenylalanine--tRNA ligase subunit alpha [Candidatus Woesearchaeota archaeon]|nr:phenylalanine--tRNA ligase subunit alpha [Candidatus Woesearchaeota archaeon]